MAKSQGNILKIKDFKTKYNGQVLRLALITSHYRQGLDWNDKLISECEKTLTKWYSAHIEVKEKITVKTRQYAKRQSTWSRGQMSEWQKIKYSDLKTFIKKFAKYA